MEGAIDLLSPYASSWPKPKSKKKGEEVSEHLVLPKMELNRTATPFITAASLRGALRRAAMDVVLSVTGKKLPNVAAYYFNTVGGAKGRKVTVSDSGPESAATGADQDGDDNDNDNTGEKADSKKIPEAGLTDFTAARKRNPILGLFGASDVMGSLVGGHVNMGNAIPGDDFVVGVYRGVRQDDARVRPELVEQFVQDDDLMAQVSALHEQSRRHAALKAKIVALKRLAFSDETKGSTAGRKAKDDLKAVEKEEKSMTDVSIMMPLAGFEYLGPTTLAHDMVLKNVSKVEAGMFFLAISRLMDDPILGSHRSLGFGRFKAAWTVQVSGSAEQAELKADPYNGIECDHPFVAEAIEAALAAIRSGEVVLTVPTVDGLKQDVAA
jgi:CRISPR type IV-associated protein Csf2